MLYASAKAAPSCLAREDTGGGGRAPAQLTRCLFAQRVFQSYWLAEFLPGFFQRLCIEYQSSSLTGLPHKLATVTKKEAQRAPLAWLPGGESQSLNWELQNWDFSLLTRNRTLSVWCPLQKNLNSPQQQQKKFLCVSNV